MSIDVSELVDSLKVRLNQIESSRGLPPGCGVNQDRCFVTVHNRICELITANAEILDADCAGDRTEHQFTDDLDAERIVAQEGCFRYPPQEYAGSFVLLDGLDFIDSIEEAMAGLAHHSEIFARIILENQRQLNAVLGIALEGLRSRPFFRPGPNPSRPRGSSGGCGHGSPPAVGRLLLTPFRFGWPG